MRSRVEVSLDTPFGLEVVSSQVSRRQDWGLGVLVTEASWDCSAAVAVAVYIVPICFWYIVLPAPAHGFPRPSSVTLVCCPLLRLLFSLETSMATGSCCFCLPAAALCSLAR